MHNNIRVSVVATGIDCEKRVDTVQNLISEVETSKSSLYTPINKEIDNNTSESNTVNKEENFKLEKNYNEVAEEVLEKIVDPMQDSFIPPEPEVVEKEIITPEEIQIDPFTEAEVLNASSSIQQIIPEVEQETEVKETESLIKRFTGKFGSSNKKDVENIQNNLEEQHNTLNNELSFSPEISMKSNEKNTNEDTLDIPAFLRRQRE
jgi:hypothetical protein